MYFERAKSADKNIVNRRRRLRNPDVSAAIKQTRAKLNEGGTVDFSEEMLRKHALALATVGPILPLVIMMIAGLSFVAGFGYQSIAWAFVAIICYGGLSYTACRLRKIDFGKANLDRYTQILVAGHFLTGLVWTWFALFKCVDCGIAQVSIIQAAVILLAMASSAILTSTFRRALLLTYSMPVVAFGSQTSNLANPVELVMALMLFVGLFFFMFIEKFMEQSASEAIVHQAEKDTLIADLATAKAMSDEARNRSEEANLAKSRFLASMSHELRTPLNAILGFSEVMAKEVLGPMENATYKDYANDINTSGHHLLNLINEILDLSRIEAGRQTLSEECVKLIDIAEDAVHLMTLKARAKEIKIVCVFENTMSYIWADERSVRQISLNLLSNAVKFTPIGGQITVKVGWTNSGGQYILVKDDGPGIPEDEIPIVLSAFGQGSIAIKSAEQGTGLGLPIVQAMVNMHGGTFELHSKLREGTEALAMFPRSRVAIAMKKISETTALGKAS